MVAMETGCSNEDVYSLCLWVNPPSVIDPMRGQMRIHSALRHRQARHSIQEEGTGGPVAYESSFPRNSKWIGTRH